MIPCPECGEYLVRCPILLSRQIRDYNGPRWYWCSLCGIQIYVDENDRTLLIDYDASWGK